MKLLRSFEVHAGEVVGQTRQLIAQVSENELREWVETISIPRHFVSQPENNRKIRDWIRARFESWGYNVASQGEWANLIALPPKSAGKLLLVGAHYDSKPNTPGADDNGSAVAAMLACAKALSQLNPSPPIMFVAFNREEDDLTGSRDFVAHLGELDFEIAGAHILEMVGYASNQPGSQNLPSGLPIKLPEVGDFLGILGNRNSDELPDLALTAARTYVPDLPAIALKVPMGMERFFPVLLRSDHAPFWEAGLPAVMWTDTSEYRNANYHQPTDTPDTLDYTFLKRVTQALIATVVS